MNKELLETIIIIRDATYHKARRAEEKHDEEANAERLYAMADTLNLVIDMIGDPGFTREIKKFYEKYETEED